jgi:hypothetical protein
MEVITMENLEKKLGRLRSYALAAALAVGAVYSAGCEEEESYCCKHKSYECSYNNICVDDADEGESTKSLVVTRSDGTKEYCDCVYSPPDNDNGRDLLGDDVTVQDAAGHFDEYIQLRSVN